MLKGLPAPGRQAGPQGQTLLDIHSPSINQPRASPLVWLLLWLDALMAANYVESPQCHPPWGQWCGVSPRDSQEQLIDEITDRSQTGHTHQALVPSLGRWMSLMHPRELMGQGRPWEAWDKWNSSYKGGFESSASLAILAFHCCFPSLPRQCPSTDVSGIESPLVFHSGPQKEIRPLLYEERHEDDLVTHSILIYLN